MYPLHGNLRPSNRLEILILSSLMLLLSSNALLAEDYRVGIVPQYKTSKIFSIWTPIIEMLEQETGHSFTLIGSPDIPSFELALLKGEFDLAYMNPYHLILANQKQGYIPIVRDRGRALYGILTVHKESKITSPAHLEGMEIAFPAPNALGASLMMRQELTDLFQISFDPIYVNTHDSVYMNVVLQQTSAGGGVQKTLNHQKEQIKSRLRIIHKTTSVAPHPIAVHPNVPETIRRSIQMALLNYVKNESGAEIMAKIPIKTVGPATLEDYHNLKEMGLERFYHAPQE